MRTLIVVRRPRPDGHASDRVLRAARYLPHAAHNLDSAALLAQSACVDAVVVDKPDGASTSALIAFIRHVRTQAPRVVILAAIPCDGRVEALHAGADAILSDACGPEEVVAQLDAIWRRDNGVASAPPQPASRVEIGVAAFDQARRALVRDGLEVALSRAEYTLLECFLRNNGRVLGRQSLARMLELSGHEIKPRSIDVSVLRLRRLIEPDPERPTYLRTIRGVGYRFRMPIMPTRVVGANSE